MTTKTNNTLAALKRRIRHFYKLLNAGDVDACYEMIDPSVRLKPTSVTLLQYENSVRQFLDHVGSVSIAAIELELHLDEANKLYEDRDFAIGKLVWSDDGGKQHISLERWVHDDGAWYTRCTGFVLPASVEKANDSQTEKSTVPRRRRRA